MIKVIHVLSDMKIGGAGIWLLNLLGSVDRERLEIKVVLPQGSMLVDKVRELGFEAITVEGMQDRSFDRAAVSLLLNIFKKERPHIVHTHASLSARLAAKMSGAKIINTKHCMDVRKLGIKRLAGVCLNNWLSDGIVAVSGAVRQNMLDNGADKEKITVVYGGIRPVRELDQEEKSLVRQSWGITDQDTVVGIVARLAEVKGHKYFLEAAEIISREKKDIKFIIAGGGPKEQELKEQAKRLGIEDKVVFTGFIENIYEILNILDINVISSLSEALCLSLIEGMSIGKPSVGTDTGGVPEVVKDGYNGFLVPAGDPEKLASVILKLIIAPELRQAMGDRGRRLAAESFTAGAMAKGIEELYEAVSKKNRRECGEGNGANG
jgi:glycosyltransferase involved in cell wall biosynthesis